MSRPPALDLRDRVLLVTGGARGIGLDTARRAAAQGRAGRAAGRRRRRGGPGGAGHRPAGPGLGGRRHRPRALDAVVDEVAGAFGGIDSSWPTRGVAPPGHDPLRRRRRLGARARDQPRRRLPDGQGDAAARGRPREHVLVVASVYALTTGCWPALRGQQGGLEALGRALRTELARTARRGRRVLRLHRHEACARRLRGPDHAGAPGGPAGFIAQPLPVGRAAARAGLERRARVMVPALGPGHAGHARACSRSPGPADGRRRAPPGGPGRAADAEVPAGPPAQKLTQASSSR